MEYVIYGLMTACAVLIIIGLAADEPWKSDSAKRLERDRLYAEMKMRNLESGLTKRSPRKGDK